MSLRDNPNIITDVSELRRDLDELALSVTSDGSVTTNMLADGAVTSDKVDWTSFDSADWPALNVDTANNNINSNQWYGQYSYTVPVSGVYLFMFSQRMTTGENSRELNVRIYNTTKNSQIGYGVSGGFSWPNWIQTVAYGAAYCDEGDVVAMQSVGGGSGSYGTQAGRATIVRLR